MANRGQTPAPSGYGLPLYLGVKDAAAWAGIGQGAMECFVKSIDPPPHMLIGRKVYVETASLPEYLRRKQIGR